MSTDLATLLGRGLKRKAEKEDDDDDDGEEKDEDEQKGKKPSRSKKPRKTKEEREAEELQRELLFQEKYVCDYETYTIESVEMRRSNANPDKQVAVIKWLDNRRPPDLSLIGPSVIKLASACFSGVQGERDWHRERDLYSVTSSMVARALAMDEPHVSADRRVKNSQETLLQQARLLPKFEGNTLTEHGKNMEPFARRVYMQESAKQSVIQIGFIPHPTNKLCGASPDGITIDGSRLVELKCPMKRYFQQGDPVPLGYWHQVKFQIEICCAVDPEFSGRNDYFECRHMRRPRGLRTNCVAVLRDNHWFDAVQPVIRQYDLHLKRLRFLRALFPKHMFESQPKRADAFQVVNTMPKLFKAVVLED
jgi:hypothetical protein